MGVNDWDGTRALALLRERMNRLFDERQGRGASTVEGAFAPATDVYSTDEAVFVAVELPGVVADDVTVEIEGGELAVRGRRHFAGGESAAYHRLERSYGEFRCAIALPDDADAAKRRVRLAGGVLTVEIPRIP
ncbi:MAG TPA: Hsp20/alpha crystallin family protein [Polyangia bacterium]